MKQSSDVVLFRSIEIPVVDYRRLMVLLEALPDGSAYDFEPSKIQGNLRNYTCDELRKWGEEKRKYEIEKEKERREREERKALEREKKKELSRERERQRALREEKVREEEEDKEGEGKKVRQVERLKKLKGMSEVSVFGSLEDKKKVSISTTPDVFFSLFFKIVLERWKGKKRKKERRRESVINILFLRKRGEKMGGD